MDHRARVLIADLDLRPHPEGGYYRQVFRSERIVHPADGRSERSAITAIYFLLVAGQHSAWHRVASDEVWTHIEGDAIALWRCDVTRSDLRRLTLGRAGEGCAPIHAIPAGEWQAAEPLGAYALTGCMVGPGFDFADFVLARDDPPAAELLRRAGSHERLF